MGSSANPVVIDPNTGQLGTVDMSALAGTNGATGAKGDQGISGTNGMQGMQGIRGLTGVGLMRGAFIFLESGTAAPAGFTLVGTRDMSYKNLNRREKTLVLDIYQKN